MLGAQDIYARGLKKTHCGNTRGVDVHNSTKYKQIDKGALID